MTLADAFLLVLFVVGVGAAFLANRYERRANRRRPGFAAQMSIARVLARHGRGELSDEEAERIIRMLEGALT